jgi:DNA-binding PadR family transcriptional regulator
MAVKKRKDPAPDSPAVPLTPAAFHILLALADGDRHGYEIMREVQRLSGGRVKLGPATLYRTIAELLRSKWIEENDERPDPELDDERRRYYTLSADGKRVARAEAQRYAELVRAATDKRLVSPRSSVPKPSGAS